MLIILSCINAIISVYYGLVLGREGGGGLACPNAHNNRMQARRAIKSFGLIEGSLMKRNFGCISDHYNKSAWNIS